jgi:hypothetical protein
LSLDHLVSFVSELKLERFPAKPRSSYRRERASHLENDYIERFTISRIRKNNEKNSFETAVYDENMAKVHLT